LNIKGITVEKMRFFVKNYILPVIWVSAPAGGEESLERAKGLTGLSVHFNTR
jgi:hypothetical protein